MRLVQVGVTALLLIEVATGMSAKHHQEVLNRQAVRVEQKLKGQYDSARAHRPTSKAVKTSYQRAMKLSQKYLALENQLHDQPDNKKVKKQLKKLPVENSGLLVPKEVKNWHGSISYSGQDNQGRLMMAFRFTGDDGKDREVVTGVYDAKRGKLGKFKTYRTKAGRTDVKNAIKVAKKAGSQQQGNGQQ